MATKKKPNQKVQGSAKSTGGKRVVPQEDGTPFRRELGAVIYAFLGVFILLSYFPIDALFIQGFSTLLKGCIGVGFWLYVPVMFLTAYILTFHHGEPVVQRIVSAQCIPLVFSCFCYGLIHTEFRLPWTDVVGLWEQGLALKGCGVLGSLVGILFTTCFSGIGATLIFFVLICFLGMGVANRSIMDIVDWLAARPTYEKKPVKEKKYEEKEEVQNLQKKKDGKVKQGKKEEVVTVSEEVDETVSFVRTNLEVNEEEDVVPPREKIEIPPEPVFPDEGEAMQQQQEKVEALLKPDKKIQLRPFAAPWSVQKESEVGATDQRSKKLFDIPFTKEKYSVTQSYSFNQQQEQEPQREKVPPKEPPVPADVTTHYNPVKNENVFSSMDNVKVGPSGVHVPTPLDSHMKDGKSGGLNAFKTEKNTPFGFFNKKKAVTSPDELFKNEHVPTVDVPLEPVEQVTTQQAEPLVELPVAELPVEPLTGANFPPLWDKAEENTNLMQEETVEQEIPQPIQNVPSFTMTEEKNTVSMVDEVTPPVLEEEPQVQEQGKTGLRGLGLVIADDPIQMDETPIEAQYVISNVDSETENRVDEPQQDKHESAIVEQACLSQSVTAPYLEESEEKTCHNLQEDRGSTSVSEEVVLNVVPEHHEEVATSFVLEKKEEPVIQKPLSSFDLGISADPTQLPQEMSQASTHTGFVMPSYEKEDNEEEIAQVQQQVNETTSFGAYKYPPLSLLKPGSVSDTGAQQAELQENLQRLEVTLQSFKIKATMENVVQGPSVTRYEVKLEQGEKLNKLTNLSDDIALALGASGVRIAPIADKISTVGIEVPNKAVAPVEISQVIGAEQFTKSQSKVSFAVGKDITGQAVVGNIAKMPHLLVAGTTGSGKSVCTNSLIISLLYKASPEEVRLIMVDPKMVELGIYNGIPHLLIPVVTDPKKAAGALQWAVYEMMKRYKLFSEVGARDLATYNEIAEKSEHMEKMPQVVVIIDELADLMLVAAKEVEESICRVAQMGRASGMHLIIATQRPSADVITGLMKANIPSRIAFAVSSGMDSRIILDVTGAEKLVGRGDMLYAPLGEGKPTRVQGCLISDAEVAAVVNFVKQESGTATYSEEIMEQIDQNVAAKEKGTNKDKNQSAPDLSSSEQDEMLYPAIDVIFETKQASVSVLQRKLKIGYARAARIVDSIEDLGIVGESEGGKGRQILITKEQWQEMKYRNGQAGEGNRESWKSSSGEDTL